MKVVIVEDEIRIREGIVKLLKKLDSSYEIVGEAWNGLDGLEICKKEKPDLVITDIKMPQMDGLQMLVNMSREGMHPKVIVLSAYSEFEYARGAMRLGVTEYLLKPISLSEFSQALENIKEQIEKDNQKKPDQVGTMNQVFRDIIDGRMEISEQTATYLSKNYNISVDQSFIIICIYLGSNFEADSTRTQGELIHSFSRYKANSWESSPWMDRSGRSTEYKQRNQ